MRVPPWRGRSWWPLPFRHDGQHATHEARVLIHASWFQQVLHLGREGVNVGVASGELRQGRPELEQLLEILWTRSAGVGIDEVGNRRVRPRGVDEGRGLREERG